MSLFVSGANEYYHLRLDLLGGPTPYKVEELKLTHSLIEDGNLSFGNAPSAGISFDLYDAGPSINNQEITLFQGIEQEDSTITYNCIGTFYVRQVSKDNVKHSYEGYDAMVYALSGTYKSTLDWSSGKMWHTSDVIKDIEAQTGIQYMESEDYPLSAVFVSEPKGLSYRTVLGYAAGLDGYNCVIKYTETGEPLIAMSCFNKTWKHAEEITIDDDRIYEDSGFELSNEDIKKIGYVKTMTSEDNFLVSGDENADFGITTYNPYMTQDWNDDVLELYNTINMNVFALSVKFLGFWDIELGDIIPITHEGVTYNIPVMSLTQECDGGLITTVASFLQDETTESAASSSVEIVSNQTELRNLKINIEKIKAETISVENLAAKVAEITTLKATDAIIKNIQAEVITTDAIKASVAQIDSLTADDAIIKSIYSDKIVGNSAILNILQSKVVTTEDLSAKVANINSLTANSAIIKNIQSTAITTDSIKASVADISTLTAKDAIIENISTKLLEADSGFINKLSVVSLNADNATISDLIAKTAKINNLIYGSATGTSITTEFSNSVIAQLGSAQIKNAMIDSVSASKINTGTINTNDVTIQSSDGNMLLKGNLQQFKDKLGNVRIQIGQDTSGSFNFIVKGADGSTALFDSNGITKDGVPDGLIVDAKVSENANIKGSKLDIDSVISGINDNNSTYLKTSKIYSDVNNQTLEVLFARQEARIEGVENVAYGQIVTYNVDEIPTLENYPAMDWVSGPYPADDLFPSDDLAFQYSNEEYRKHLGSVCYVKDSTSTYKFVIQADGSFGWSEITDSETAILNQKLSDLTVTVNGINGRVSETETKISSQATTITSMQSSISQNTQNISLKVSKETYESGMRGKANKSSIISEINQSAESITINASKLNLTGYVTLTNLSTSGQTNIDGGNITTGKISAERIDADKLKVKGANIDEISCDKLNGGTISGQAISGCAIEGGYLKITHGTDKTEIADGVILTSYIAADKAIIGSLSANDFSALFKDKNGNSVGDIKSTSDSKVALNGYNGFYLYAGGKAVVSADKDGCNLNNLLSINGINSKQIVNIEMLESGQVLVGGSGTYTFTFNTAKASLSDYVEIVPIVTRGVLWSESTNGDLTSYTVRNIISTSVYISMKILKISYKSLS